MEIIKKYKDLKPVFFKNEKHMQTFFVENISEFVETILEDELLKCFVEMPVRKVYKFGPRAKRIDMYLECKKKKYIIEFKNPKYISDNISAIGQILDYGRIFPEHELLIISTYFDVETIKTIDYYKLPIRYFYTDNKSCIEYKKDYFFDPIKKV
jgi:hypothetical protein